MFRAFSDFIKEMNGNTEEEGANQCSGPPSSNCMYFLPKKRRLCRFAPVRGEKYCVEHCYLFSSKLASATNEIEFADRIPCPLDSSHTCSKSKLSKHMKKCNATKSIPKEAWYVKDINSDSTAKKENLDMVLSLKDAGIEEVKFLISKISAMETLSVHPYIPDIHPALFNELQSLQNCPKALKHTRQNSSLLCLMEKHKLIRVPACIVEFGAGRAQFTDSVIQAIESDRLTECHFVIVDRGVNRRKKDAKLRREGVLDIERIRVDIRDVALKHINAISEHPTSPIVAIGKHLCGSATDLTLRCLTQDICPNKVRGGIIALCCHHRCTWDDYCGKEYFVSQGLTAREFSIMTLLSSWAVCHFTNGQKHNGVASTTQVREGGPYDFLCQEEKERIGFKCKRIIDQGRVDFFGKNSFVSCLSEYTTTSVSLENTALIFTTNGRVI